MTIVIFDNMYTIVVFLCGVHKHVNRGKQLSQVEAVSQYNSSRCCLEKGAI